LTKLLKFPKAEIDVVTSTNQPNFGDVTSEMSRNFNNLAKRTKRNHKKNLELTWESNKHSEKKE